MGRGLRIGVRLIIVLATLIIVANVLHRVVVPQAPPDPATYPRVGDTFGSQAEGFIQEVIGARDGWLLLRTTIAPRAPGPPTHFHRLFAEVFTVETGTLSVELPMGVVTLRPGQSYRVEPGVPHRPHNLTNEEVVIASDEPAMPASFAACLVQIYPFLDEASGQVGPELAVRILALDSTICDSTSPDIPPAVSVGLDWLVLPFARVMGYRNYYPELSLHP